MPAASTAIAPRGGYNHASVYYLSPQTGSSTAGDISVLTAPSSGSIYALFDGDEPGFRCNIIRNYSGSTFLVAPNTADAADSASLGLGGGGDALTSRGATAILYGNEHANAGRLTLLSGTGGGLCILGCGTGAGVIQFYGNGSAQATMSATGVFNLTSLTASKLVYTNGSKDLVSTAPADATFTATVTVSSGTCDGGSGGENKFQQIGNYIFFYLRATSVGITSGTPSTIRVLAPAAGAAITGVYPMCLTSNGTAITGFWGYDGTYITIIRDAGTFSAGGSPYLFNIQGFYPAS